MFSFLPSVYSAQRVRVVLAVFFGLIFFHVGVFVYAEKHDSTDNLFLDSDQDGLSNQEEAVYGTNQNVSDSDGDGYTDGAEVKSGYDPTKPAPGDKLVQENSPSETSKKQGRGGDNTTETSASNLTQQISDQIIEIIQSSSETKGALSMDEITTSVQDILSKQQAAVELPEIDTKTIKIKDQTYKTLTESERSAKISQDVLEYASGVAYIIINNSPVTIQSQEDISKVINALTQQTLQASMKQDITFADEMQERGEAILKQLNQIEVPEKMLDIHIKGLQIVTYAIAIKQDATTDSKDPLSNIYNLSKAQALFGMMVGFSGELETALVKYGVTSVPLLDK